LSGTKVDASLMPKALQTQCILWNVLVFLYEEETKYHYLYLSVFRMLYFWENLSGTLDKKT